MPKYKISLFKEHWSDKLDLEADWYSHDEFHYLRTKLGKETFFISLEDCQYSLYVKEVNAS